VGVTASGCTGQANASNCYFFDELDDALEWVEDGVLASDPSREATVAGADATGTSQAATVSRYPSTATINELVSGGDYAGGVDSSATAAATTDAIDVAATGPKSVATILANYVTFYEDDEMQLEAFLERFKAEDTSFDAFFERTYFPKGSVIYKQDEVSDAVYFISSGEVELMSEVKSGAHGACRGNTPAAAPVPLNPVSISPFSFACLFRTCTTQSVQHIPLLICMLIPHPPLESCRWLDQTSCAHIQTQFTLCGERTKIRVPVLAVERRPLPAWQCYVGGVWS
jgi:hypothetical protein